MTSLATDSCSRKAFEISLAAKKPWRTRFWVGSFSLIIFSLALVSSALSRAPTADEKNALATTITEFDDAMRTSNFEKVIDLSIPVRVMALLAKKAGAPAEALRRQVIILTARVMASASLESFSMDLPAAEQLELASGAPYMLIPTITVIKTTASERAVSKSHTLAVMDEGKWYLVRISEPQQIALVREAYPEFTGIDFPQGNTEIIKQ